MTRAALARPEDPTRSFAMSTFVRGLLPALLLLLAACGGDEAPNTSSRQSAPDPAQVAREKIAELTEPEAVSAEKAWEQLQAVRAAEQQASPQTLTLWGEARRRLQDRILRLDPDFAPLREERGERKYDGALEAFVEATWLPEHERSEARKLHEKLERLTGKEQGWAKASHFAALDELLPALKAKKVKYDELMESPWARRSIEIENEIVTDLDKRFANRIGDAKNPWRGVEVVRNQPYLFFVQKDPSWDPIMVARSRSRSLQAVEALIMHEYAKELGLTQVEQPIPVLLFRSYDDYKQYSGLPPGTSTYAHFEPYSGRLAIHDDCDHTTVMHEGTHQLMFFWSKNRLNTGMRSYWWNEGVAEWYAGAKRVRDPESKEWKYLLNRVHQGRLSTLKQSFGHEQSQDKLYSLKELIATRYVPHKGEAEASGRVGELYAQSWFFIYFLNNYNVAEDGRVRIGQGGPYQAGWRRYVQAELEGRSGPKVFLECMGWTLEDLERVQEEYWRYFTWVRRKVNYNHTDDGILIPYDQYVNKRGRKTGRPEDDILPEKAEDEG